MELESPDISEGLPTWRWLHQQQPGVLEHQHHESMRLTDQASESLWSMTDLGVLGAAEYGGIMWEAVSLHHPRAKRFALM